MDWGQSELPSPVVRDDEVTVAARRRRSKKVACILSRVTRHHFVFNLDDSDWTSSMYVSPVSGMENSSFFTDDIANLSSALLKEDDPGEAAAASLFPEFLTSFLKHSSTAVFELLEDYQLLLQDKVDVLQSVVLRAGQSSKTAGVRWLLQQENCSWRLITSLYRDRVQLALEDDIMTDMVLVVDWLESIAKDQIGDFSDNIEYYAKNVCWENTLHALKTRSKSGTAFNIPLVTELDPDAPHRQQRPLADLDREDDARLLKNLFTLIRAGMTEEVEEPTGRKRDEEEEREEVEGGRGGGGRNKEVEERTRRKEG
ncbi:Nuclear pore complex protein Nup107 [Liparis tanakae]|uniref:Nuclear pore complex protein n=1 Tax=Liparis tanakae TaxID=230148 RepID=A0A4Z2GNC5_9TELE|nr:Nuclear pore complex protein Nup107 [Liparis tanakae]